MNQVLEQLAGWATRPGASEKIKYEHGSIPLLSRGKKAIFYPAQMPQVQIQAQQELKSALLLPPSTLPHHHPHFGSPEPGCSLVMVLWFPLRGKTETSQEGNRKGCQSQVLPYSQVLPLEGLPWHHWCSGSGQQGLGKWRSVACSSHRNSEGCPPLPGISSCQRL